MENHNLIKEIPIGIYCHSENSVCPYYGKVDDLYGYCDLEKCEVLDMCKICYDHYDSNGCLNEDYQGDNFMRGNVLVIVDPQNDFINGKLGSARAMKVANKIAEELLPKFGESNNYEIYVTQDWHNDIQLKVFDELKTFGMHCNEKEEGSEIYYNIEYELEKVNCPVTYVKKETFSTDLDIKTYPISITIVGFCTDICVLAMACNLRRQYPSSKIRVNPNYCCGTTEENEEAAIKVLKSMGFITEEK